MNKWKNYGTWVSLTSATLLAVQAVGSLFGFQIAPDYDQIMIAVNAVLMVLVTAGIISNPESGKGFKDK